MSRTKQKKVRMKDVAKAAGVSVATVSAALNWRTSRVPIRKVTREKVQRVAKRLNYRIDEQARTLRLGRSRTIGVVASDITQPFSGEMLRVVEREVQKRNYSYLVSDTQNNREKEKFYLGLFLQKKVDGILLIGASNELEDEGILMLKKNGMPVVLTEREIPAEPVPCVMVDNVKGSHQATEHLIRQGRDRIGFITGPKGNVISHQRQQGYRRALRSHGLPYGKSMIAEGGLTPQCGYRAMEALLHRGDVPAAVFTFNDMTALGAMRAIRDRGLSIPADIAVVGYDDIPIAAYSEPPLTTIRQPVDQMCREAVQILLDILDDKLPKEFHKRTTLEPELIVRRSCGHEQ